MKKLFLVCLIVTALAACNTPSSESPSATIDGMFTAMKNGNVEDMKKFITKNDVNMLESAEKLMMSVNPEGLQKMKDKMTSQFKEKVKDVTYTLKNEKVDGNNATVDAEVTEGGKKDTHTFNLVKEDGAWKVALLNSKDGMFNSMKGDMGNEMQDAQDGLEKLRNMPPDSLKKLMDKGLEMMDSANKKMKEN